MEKHIFDNLDRPIALVEQNNLFLIDWLTFTAHGESVEYIKYILGLDSPSIPWEDIEKFRNGYPMQCYWNGITISYGADDERYYKDPSKARSDMGISVNLSGKGCRAFESYGHGDWFRLFTYLFRNTDHLASSQRVFKRYNITRLDLAYDDHTGILDIYRIEQDTRDRCYTSKATKSEITWSDNKESDIRGLNVQIGSDKSTIKIRIYDKAAERGFKDRHWIRVEKQLRDDRAKAAAAELLACGHIGRTASGILRNYLVFRSPTEDSNPSRWPVAKYWDDLLLDMDRISLWVSPGEEYNISHTEYWLFKQYGPVMSVLSQLHDPIYIYDKCKALYPVSELPPKYKSLLADLEANKPFGLTSDFAEALEIFKEDPAHETEYEYQNNLFD